MAKTILPLVAGPIPTVLSVGYTYGDTSIQIDDITDIPSAPNIITVKDGNIFITLKYGSKLGYSLSSLTYVSGSQDHTFPVGSSVVRSIAKYDFDAIDNDKVDVYQGEDNEGKTLIVNSDGDLELGTISGTSVWGGITGTLSDQTDLNTALNSKQNTLVSGTNIKTINSTSILGSGDITITGTSVWGNITGDISSQTDLQTALNGKVNTETGKGLSTNDYTDSDKSIVDGVTTALANKVDKETGKGLSTNDYTTAEKTKLAGIESEAEVNIIETVKVNGTALTPTSKAVDVTVPTKTSDITNDSDYQTGTNVDTKISTHNSSNSAHSDIRTSITDHTSNTSNPHSVTKSQVGLGNCDNTSDLNKPISTATQAALDLKADSSTLTSHTENVSNPHSVTKAQVGLGNCDNTSDVNKPISTATQTALDLKLGTVYSSAEDGYIAKVDSADHKLKVMAAGTTTVAFADITGQPSDNTNLNTALSNKVDKVTGKGLSENDYTDTDKDIVDNVTTNLAGKVDKVTGKSLVLDTEITKLSGIEAGAEVNIIEDVKLNGTSLEVSSKSVDVVVNKSTVGLGNCDNTSDVNKPISTATQTALNNKQDKITSSNKLLSDLVDTTSQTNLFVTSSEKTTWNGKQSAITSSNKLSSDLVDDTDKTNLFVTSSEKSTWNSKQSALTFDNVPTEDSSNPVKSGGVYSALAGKVDTETGKGLSTNDYTTAEKTKLNGIETGAEVNVLESVKDSSGTALTITGKAVTLSKAAVGLGNVDNTADSSKIFDASQVTSGVFGIARIPTGTTSSTVCVGDDSRLSDARTPLAHNHSGSDITSGTVAYARLPVGTAASTVCAGDDSRFTTLSNHVASTSNPHSVTKSQVGLGNCDNTSDANKPISTATQTALDGKQAKHSTATATLTVAGWSSKSQTVSVSGVTASNTVFVAPSGSSYSDYATSLIRCTAQASGTLTFVCDEVPSSAVTVNVVILA